jgi:uncharacterized Fe-S cluster protein YjdI
MAKEYTNGEVTIVWKPDLCIHSENCVKGLPSVFDVNARPWINAEGASSEAIIAQVAKCPSGALSIKEQEQNIDQKMDNSTNSTSLKVFPDGPVQVPGPCEIAMPDGTVQNSEKDVFLCRCGQSTNKPFCDGSHKKHGFKG